MECLIFPLLCVDWIFLVHPLLNETKLVCASFFTVLFRIGEVILFCFVTISLEKRLLLIYFGKIQRERERDKTRYLLECWHFSCHILYPKAIPKGKKITVFQDGSFESMHSTHLVVI